MPQSDVESLRDGGPGAVMATVTHNEEQVTGRRQKNVPDW